MDLQTPPQPAPDADSAGFWAATAAGELRLCRCADCRRWHQPPLGRCPACGGATGFELVSGCGRIKSFIVVRHPAVPGYLEDLPYVVAIVDLDEQEGLRLPGRLLDADPARVDVGRAVRAEIVDLPGGDFRVAAFRLADPAP